jgi:trimeric autotransporter adhesin
MPTARLSQAWQIVGAGNINSAGAPDILWHNTTTGALVVWNLVDSGATYTAPTTAFFGNYAPGTYEFKDAGDFDGDGDADLLVMLKATKAAQLLKTQAGALLAPISLASQAAVNPGAGGTGTEWTPEVVIAAAANSAAPVSDGGSNTAAAKSLGEIGTTTTVTANSEAWHGGTGAIGNADSYVSFTIAAPTQVAITLSSNKVWGFGTTPSGSGQAWGTIGSTGSTSANYNQTTGSFLLNTPGTYYYRVQSRLGSSAAAQAVPFGITITGSAPAAAPALATAIDPGDKGSSAEAAIRMGASTYFLASDGEAGLWKTDGTAAGTAKVAGLQPAGGGMVVNGTTLYFTADGNDGKGAELWKSDGTAAGTVRVADINAVNAGADNSDPANLTLFNGLVYFTANNGVEGREIWKTDGTAAGTVLAANVNTQLVNGVKQGSNPSNLIAFNGHLVFAADDGVNGRELLRLSTTGTLTAVSTTTPGGLDPKQLVVAGTALYGVGAFGGQSATGQNQDIEPFRVDPNWSVNKYDLAAGPNSSFASGLTVWGTDVYLSAKGAAGYELSRLNATSGLQIADLNPGATGATQNSSYPRDFQVLNSKLIFAAGDAANGREVWTYNGTGAPTRLSQIAAGAASANPIGLTTINGNVYFAAAATGEDIELYKTDGTTVSLVKDVNPGSDASVPIGFTDAGNGKTLFFGFDNNQGFEPWVTDGSTAGTLNLKNINTTPNEGPGAGVTLGSWTYFPTTDKAKGRELYRTDGTTTQLVSDILPGVRSSDPANLTVAGGWVYFTATTDANGTKLWRTNGTTTEIATNVNALTVSDGVSQLSATPTGDLYFTASGPNGTALHKMGTGNANTQVKAFGNGSITEMKSVGSEVWLGAKDGTAATQAGIEPWKVSSTGVITSIGDINPGVKGSVPYDFVQTTNGDTYFAAFTPTNGYEVYRVPAGSTTPQLLKDINPGAPSANIAKLTAMADRVYFAAYNGTNLVIYKSDGTAAGTVAIGSLNQGGPSLLSPDTIPVTGKEGLNFQDYLSLTKLETPAGKSIYMAGPFNSKRPLGPYIDSTGGNGTACYPAWVPAPGRSIYQDFAPGTAPFTNADAQAAYPGSGLVGSTPGQGATFEEINDQVSVEYGPTCTIGNSSNLYASPQSDSRISTFDDVILGAAGTRLYIAGWRSQNGGYEVWSMPHTEAFVKRLNQYGMQDRRNLKFEGTFNVDRGSLKLQPASTFMLIQGFDATAKQQKQWKLQ